MKARRRERLELGRRHCQTIRLPSGLVVRVYTESGTMAPRTLEALDELARLGRPSSSGEGADREP